MNLVASLLPQRLMVCAAACACFSGALSATPLEAYFSGPQGGELHVRLTGGDRKTLHYEEVSAPGVDHEIAVADLHAVTLVEPPGFAEALSLAGSRRYKAAREKFTALREAYADFAFLPDNPATRAAFQIMECLRQEGDLEALAHETLTFDRSKLSREYEQRQFDLYAMWDAVRTQSWDRLEDICRERLQQRLPGSQRAQAACCLGLALEAKAKPDEALNAYHEALAAPAGGADATTRMAAIHAMRLYRRQPQVAAELDALLKRKEAGTVDQSGPGLRELLALAQAYAAHFGAGEPLPDDLKDLLLPPAGKKG